MCSWAMRKNVLGPFRSRVAGGAEGRVLVIGIGSWLNLPLYDPRLSPRSHAAAAGLMRSLPAPSLSIRLLHANNQHSPGQYDDFAGVPCAQAGAGGGRRTIAPGHRRYSSPRCACRVAPPICDAWPIGLSPGGATQVGAKTGFGAQRPGAKIRSHRDRAEHRDRISFV